MPARDKETDRSTLLQGTLDLLILKTLILGPHHGQGIARSIEQRSEGVFLVEHGSLYLALQRLEEKGWLSGAWSVSESNRKARFYKLTAKGRSQLAKKAGDWHKIARAMSLIVGESES